VAVAACNPTTVEPAQQNIETFRGKGTSSKTPNSCVVKPYGHTAQRAVPQRQVKTTRGNVLASPVTNQSVATTCSDAKSRTSTNCKVPADRVGQRTPTDRNVAGAVYSRFQSVKTNGSIVGSRRVAAHRGNTDGSVP
jgi:hypothetical protein